MIYLKPLYKKTINLEIVLFIALQKKFIIKMYIEIVRLIIKIPSIFLEVYNESLIVTKQKEKTDFYFLSSKSDSYWYLFDIS